MLKTWSLLGVLALVNVTVALAIFVTPGLIGPPAGPDPTVERLPGVIDAVTPSRFPFWFVAVPRAGSSASRGAPQVEASTASAGTEAYAADVSGSGAPASIGSAAMPASDRLPVTSETRRRFASPPTTALLTPLGLYPAGQIGAGMALLSFLTFLGLASATAFVMPGRLQRIRAAVTVSPRRLVVLTVLGLLALTLAALVVQVLLLLVVSLVLTPIVAGAVAASVFLGLVAMLLVVGATVRHRFTLPATSPLLDLMVGMLVVFPFTLVPALGWVVTALVCSAGTGAVIATKFGDGTGWSLASLSEGQS